MATPTYDFYPGVPGTTLRGGIATPAVGGVITTLSLVNTSGSTQAANFVSPMFGQPFVEGDLPTGEYPAFALTDDTPVPATVYSDVAWGDGSKKFSGVLLRSPASIAGSGTQTINVKNGGTAPTASSRSLSDLMAADIKVELTGVSDLTGVWVASLNTAITDAEQILVIGDGPAGKVWRIRGAFKQTGAAHGQLVCYHYVAALQNSVGGLFGIRYLGRVAQIKADQASPAPRARRLTGVLKSGATTIRTFSGHDSTETPGAIINMGHFTSFATVGTGGEWDFIQGGGSASADCTVYVKHDVTYLLKTRMVPPYNMAVDPDIPAPQPYYPYGRGIMLRAQEQTGDRPEIGVLPAWAARHVLKPSANTLQDVRVHALLGFGWRTTAIDDATNNIIVAENLGAFTGLGTPRSGANAASLAGYNVNNTSLWSGEESSAHRPSVAYIAYLATGEPQYIDWAMENAATMAFSMAPDGVTYKTTPQPINGQMSTTTAYGQRNITIQGGGTWPCGGALFYPFGARIGAWFTRDFVQTAAICPDVMPDGSQANLYLRQLCTNTFGAMAEYIAAMSADYRAGGTHYFDDFGNVIASPWMTGYVMSTVCQASQILPSANTTYVRQHLSRWPSSVAAIADVACLASYRTANYLDNNDRAERATDQVFSVGDLVSDFGTRIELVFNSTTNNITRGGPRGNFTVANGDVFCFIGGTKPFAAAVDNKRFYAVNSTGSSFQLAATVGGAPITVTANATITKFWMRLASFAPQFMYDSYGDVGGIFANLRGAIRHHEALGDTNVTAARTRMDAIATGIGLGAASDPRNALSTEYPA